MCILLIVVCVIYLVKTDRKSCEQLVKAIAIGKEKYRCELYFQKHNLPSFCD